MEIPLASPPGYVDALFPQEELPSFWFIFAGECVLIDAATRSVPDKMCCELKRSVYMGTFDKRHIFAGEIVDAEPIPQGWQWNSLRTLYGVIDDELYAVAGRAMQLLAWDRTHKYCGCCGKETVIRTSERCRECPACGHLAYPKLAPAVMALVKRDHRILLARGPHFPEKFYSVIAGYVDTGETLEQCIIREVFEEVGIKVKNISYFGSQPWPFSGSLMIAFTCDWQEGEISIDPSELLHADWFDPSNLPQLPPPLSISRILIDSVLSN
jgi:NAD+ diphosphatase